MLMYYKESLVDMEVYNKIVWFKVLKVLKVIIS